MFQVIGQKKLYVLLFYAQKSVSQLSQHNHN